MIEAAAKQSDAANNRTDTVAIAQAALYLAAALAWVKAPLRVFIGYIKPKWRICKTRSRRKVPVRTTEGRLNYLISQYRDMGHEPQADDELVIAIWSRSTRAA